MPHLGNAVLRVNVFQRGELVGSETFRARHIIVGRDPTLADLVIGSSKISREHLLLEHDGQRVFVHDLASTNGLFVNGRRTERAEVGPDDEVYVGAHQLALNIVHSEDAAAAALALDIAEPVDEDTRVDRTPIADRSFASSDDVEPASPPEAPPDDSPARKRAVTIEDEQLAQRRQELLRHWIDDPDNEVRRDTPAGELRLAILRIRADAVMSHLLIKVGRRYRLPAPLIKERWGSGRRSPSPMQIEMDGNGATQVRLAEGSDWILRRDGAEWNEVAGVREGWARRRAGFVWVTLQRCEVLTLHWGPADYHIHFVSRPVLPPVPRRRRRRRRDRALRLCFLLSGLVHGLALSVVGSQRSSLRPMALAPPTSVRRDVGVAARWTSALPLIAAPVDSSGAMEVRQHVGELHIPGGSQGYRIFGMLPAPAALDPMVPGLGSGPNLRVVAAFLRGKEVGLGALLPAVGNGPQWLLDTAGAAASVTTSDRDRLPPEIVARTFAKGTLALQMCYQKAVPADTGLTGRVALGCLVTGNGNVRTVFASNAAVEPALQGCMGAVLQKMHFAKFGGADVSVNLLFEFRRAGF